jgi:prolyl-tRNA synthetase
MATDEVHDPRCRAYGDKIVGKRISKSAKYLFRRQIFGRWALALPTARRWRSKWGPTASASRLVGALIEANHDDAGIIWPLSVAPFRVGLVNLRASDDRCRVAAEDLYAKLLGAEIEVLYDDRDESPGAKFAALDLIGLPDQLVIGPRGIAGGNTARRSARPADCGCLVVPPREIPLVGASSSSFRDGP